MPSVIIQSPGLLTTIQDSGRIGYQRFGIPVSGAMDTYSLQLANALVGNHPDAACLEITIAGPEIIFTGTGAIAISGADMRPAINGKPVPNNKTIGVKSGDILIFKGLKSGCRSYIAFAGGINVPPVMGSRSTYLRAKIGGLEGRALRAGDEIPLGVYLGKLSIMEIPGEMVLSYKSNQTIQIIPGPEVHRFDPEGVYNFLTSDYIVTEQSDRMGYRLSGNPVRHQQGDADIISAGISFGTIQIAGDGQPIILMADRQTTGGYTRIANVVSVDLTLAAQLKPGDKIRFCEITLEKAQALYIARLRKLERWYDSMKV